MTSLGQFNYYLPITTMFRRLSFAFMYLFKPKWDTGIAVPELARAIANRAPGRALDIGCGTGTNALYLAQLGWQVCGVDFVPSALAQAKRKLGAYPQVQLLIGDVTRLPELPLGERFDLALDVGCFHSLTTDGQRRYVAGLRHWLKPGGLFMLYAFQPEATRGLWGMTREMVEACFADGFRLTNYEQGQGRPSAWYYFERR